MDSPRACKGQLQCWIVRCCLGVALAGTQLAEAQAQVEVAIPTHEANIANQSQQSNKIGQSNSEIVPEEGIALLSELDRPASTVERWLAQSTVQITGVQINPTETGLEIRLETATAQQPAITTSIIGNALIADIPDAVLALPEGDSFEQFNPTEEIALITVSPRGTGIRVVVTGTNAPPIAEVSSTARTLVLQVVPGLAQAEGADDAI